MLAVTINLGCGGPHPADRGEVMTAWARAARGRRPALVFAQEVPASNPWLDVWADTYTPYGGDVGPHYRCRSVVLARNDLNVSAVDEKACPTLAYHGSYLAVAHWHLPDRAKPVVLASVHASPHPFDGDLYPWPGSHVDARHGGPKSRWPNDQLWDSDMVLATLVSLAGDGLIAAGDYNETLTGDVDGETWSRDYRKRMRGAGLSDVLLDAWSHETPTRFPSDRSQALQLDHVVVDAVGRVLAGAEPRPHRDAFWDDFAVTGRSSGPRSDHAAVWFHLNDAGDP